MTFKILIKNNFFDKPIYEYLFFKITNPVYLAELGNVTDLFGVWSPYPGLGAKI